ncbi:MAG: TetR/AcrR family transcriptional regulator [Thermoplasmata archaeon]|nr:TetR/AcrR family transcriptional regulator [Thermoplasmata archaeon]
MRIQYLEKEVIKITNRKNKIVECAINIMGIHGLNCSMDMVTKEADCSDTLIYKYFKSRNGLIAACHERICEEVIKEVRKVPFPEEIEKEYVMEYFHEIWNVYFKYVQNHIEKCEFLIQYSCQKNTYPSMYSNQNNLISEILGKNYGVNGEFDRYFTFMFFYMISIANMATVGMKKEWDIYSKEKSEAIFDLVFNGLFNTYIFH